MYSTLMLLEQCENIIPDIEEMTSMFYCMVWYGLIMKCIMNACWVCVCDGGLACYTTTRCDKWWFGSHWCIHTADATLLNASAL